MKKIILIACSSSFDLVPAQDKHDPELNNFRGTKVYFIALLSVFSNITNAQFSVELNAGTERVAIYARTFNYFDKSNKWSLYSSNRTVMYYDTCHPGFLSMNSLAYNFKPGIGICANLIADNSRLQASAGIQFQRMIKSFYLFLLSTYEMSRFTLQENYVILVFKQVLSGKVKFIFHNEFYLSFLKWGFDQSLERIKSGLEIRQTQVGFISETSQTVSNHKTTLVNLGIFIKHSF